MKQMCDNVRAMTIAQGNIESDESDICLVENSVLDGFGEMPSLFGDVPCSDANMLGQRKRAADCTLEAVEVKISKKVSSKNSGRYIM